MELVRQASGAAAATLDQVLGLDTDDAATVIQSIFRGARERKELRKHPELQKRASEAPPPMPFARSTTAAVLREVRRQIDDLSYRQIALLAAGCVASIGVLVMLPESWLKFLLRWAAPFAAMGCVRILSWALREFRHFWCVRKQYRSKEFSEWIRSRSLSGRVLRLSYRVLRLSGSVKKIEDLSHEGWRFLRSLHARGELVNELREKASARAAQESGTFSDVLLNFSVFKLLGSKRLVVAPWDAARGIARVSERRDSGHAGGVASRGFEVRCSTAQPLL